MDHPAGAAHGWETATEPAFCSGSLSQGLNPPPRRCHYAGATRLKDALGFLSSLVNSASAFLVTDSYSSIH